MRGSSAPPRIAIRWSDLDMRIGVVISTSENRATDPVRAFREMPLPKYPGWYRERDRKSSVCPSIPQSSVLEQIHARDRRSKLTQTPAPGCQIRPESVNLPQLEVLPRVEADPTP